MNMLLEEILNTEDIVYSINHNLNDLLLLIPELKDMIGFEHKHPHHHLDVWNHTLYALSLAPMDFEVRLALLLHDIGKPHCYIEGEIRKFTNHSFISKEITRNILERLHYDKNFIEKICYLVQYCDAYAHHPEKLEVRIKYLNKVKKYFKS